MCRLFALSAGSPSRSAPKSGCSTRQTVFPLKATAIPTGQASARLTRTVAPVMHKQPISAFSDAAFAEEARAASARARSWDTSALPRPARARSPTRIRSSKTGACSLTTASSPGCRSSRPSSAPIELVKGQTDSERLFALITRETRRRDGDVRAGIAAAVDWIAAHLPIYSLNLIVTTGSELFALRYPEGDTLYLLERHAGGASGSAPLHHRSTLGTLLRSDDAARRPVVVLASEPMDDDPGWRALESGELLHVDEASQSARPSPAPIRRLI